MLVERANAKINLTLDVLGKRADGYHEVDMVMQTVDLSDLIWLEQRDDDRITVDASISQIPLDNRNLAVIAAKAFQEHSGIHRGLSIHIEKKIPIAAGLAGGSSDAAAVLRGLNRLWNTDYSLDELARIGATVGSDVPFCIYGGCAIARGRGERIERVTHDFKGWVLLVRPNVYVSTPDVYGTMSTDDYATEATSPSMVAALHSGDFEQIRNHISNGMASTTYRLYPEVYALKERMEQIMNAPVFMSGSGPTLYALIPTETVGRRVYNAMRGFIRDVYLCRMM